MITEPVTFNRSQACEVLGISKNLFDTLARTGRLKVIRAGRRVIVPRTEITAFLEREIQAAAQ